MIINLYILRLRLQLLEVKRALKVIYLIFKITNKSEEVVVTEPFCLFVSVQNYR